MIFVNTLAILLFAITISNIFTVKTLKPISLKRNDFDILVPMRNEEFNVEPLIKSLLNQGGSIYVLDDNSTDKTLDTLNTFDNQIKIIEGKELPAGWLGKNFACHQLAVASSNQYLVFIDADVRINEGAIASSIEYLEKHRWDYISPYPRQKTSGLIQFLIQPILQWSWFASILFLFAYRYPKKSMAVANGQFFIIKRSAYLACGGHKEIKSEVLDDIELARSLISSGFIGGPVDGSRIAECHMYKSDKDLLKGYGKSLWRAFGGIFGSAIAITLLFATALPFIYLGLATLLILISRVVVAFKVRSNIFSSLLHPLSMLVLAILIIYSNILHKMGRLSWKGRTIS